MSSTLASLLRHGACLPFFLGAFLFPACDARISGAAAPGSEVSAPARERVCPGVACGLEDGGAGGSVLPAGGGTSGSGGGNGGGGGTAPDSGSPVSLIRRLYADSSFWNVPIPSDAVADPQSGQMVQQALVALAWNSNFDNSDLWGIPVVYAHDSDPLYTLGCRYGPCQGTVQFHIPAGSRPNTPGTDEHLTVINLDSGAELDLWKAAYDSSSGTWTAGARALTYIGGWGAICGYGQHCGGSVAAGFAEMGGVVRHEELAQGLIDHALSFTTPLTRKGYIACPATYSDGQSWASGALPEGARIQLDPAFDVSAQAWPAWEKTLARALQTYGAYVSDTGGTNAFYGEATLNLGSGVWRSLGVPDSPSLANLPWDRFRVLTLHNCN